MSYKYLTVKFTVDDIEFEADINHYPGCLAKLQGLPEDCCPEEDAELDFNALRTSDGEDASDYLDGDTWENLIYEAALNAAEKYLQEAALEGMSDRGIIFY